MVEFRNNYSGSSTYGKYLALIEVNGEKLYPCDFFPLQEGNITMMGYRYLLTSQTGDNPNPNATTLYTEVEGFGLYEDFDMADFFIPQEYGCTGVCSLAEAQDWLAANGTPKQIVYQDE